MILLRRVIKYNLPLNSVLFIYNPPPPAFLHGVIADKVLIRLEIDN